MYSNLDEVRGQVRNQKVGPAAASSESPPTFGAAMTPTFSRFV